MNQWINPFKPQSAIGNPQSSIAIRLLPAPRNAPKSKISNAKSKIVLPLPSDSFPLSYQSAIQDCRSKISKLVECRVCGG
jgi:hypothetical protein